MGDALTSPA